MTPEKAEKLPTYQVCGCSSRGRGAALTECSTSSHKPFVRGAAAAEWAWALVRDERPKKGNGSMTRVLRPSDDNGYTRLLDASAWAHVMHAQTAVIILSILLFQLVDTPTRDSREADGVPAVFPPLRSFCCRTDRTSGVCVRATMATKDG